MPLLPSNRKTRLLALPINLVELLAKKYKRKHMSNSENGSRTIKRHKQHTSSNKSIKKSTKTNAATQNSKSSDRQTHSQLFGGRILGEGGVSIILSDPRLPSIGEKEKFKLTDFQKNTLAKQVSRLRKPVGPNPNIEQYKKEAMYPFELLKSVALNESDETKKEAGVDFMMDFFGLPSYFREFVQKDRPLLEEIDIAYIKSDEGQNYYPNPEYFTKGVVNMYDPIINGEYPYHMIFDKALGDLENNKLNIGSIGTLLNYYKELGESIIPGITFLHYRGLAHFDIKVGNIFVYKIAGKIKFKLADFDLLSRIQDRVNKPESYPTSEMRADDYIYYPSVVDTYVYRKKILKQAHTHYLRKKTFLATKQEKEQPSTMAENTKMSAGPSNLKNPIYAANNLESGFINTVTHDIEQNLGSKDDKFNILSYKFYIKYMKTLGKTLSKHIVNIKHYYNLANKIKSLCMEHKLETMPLQSILHEIAEIKYGALTKAEYQTGVINTEIHYDTIEENATKIYKYFAPSNNLDELGFYSFIAKFTDIYSFCLVLLDLINSYVDYLIATNNPFSVKSDVDNIVYILQFIKTYQSVDVYLAPGKNVELRPVEPIDILKEAYAKFIKDLEIKIP
jgi:hypothetical protein